MQTATKKAEDRAARSTDDKGDLFDPHFPGARATKIASCSPEQAVYDPYFQQPRQPKGSTHV